MKNLILTKKGDTEFYTIENLEALQHEFLYLLLTIAEICKNNNLQYWLDGGTLLGAVRHKGFIPWDDDLDICLLKEDYDKLIPLLYERAKNDERIFLYFYKSGYNFWCEYLATTKLAKTNRDSIQPFRIDIFPMKLVKNCDEDINEDRRLGDIAGFYVLGKTKFNKNIKTELAKENKINILEKNKFLHFYNNTYMNRYQDVNDRNDFLLKKGHGNFSPLEFIEYKNIFPLKTASFEGYEFPIPNMTHNYLDKSYGTYFQLPPLEKRIPYNENIVHLNKSKQEVIKDLQFELEVLNNLFMQKKLKQKIVSLLWYLKNGEFKLILKKLIHINS